MDEWFNSFSKGIYLHNLCRTMTLWREREREREREGCRGWESLTRHESQSMRTDFFATFWKMALVGSH